jgi:membrane protein
MWGVVRGRGWATRIVHYWAALSLGPLFLMTALALTTGRQFSSVHRWIEASPFLGALVFQLLPIFVLTVALTLFYKLMPNTRVLWSAAAVGGLVAGAALHANSLFSVMYMSKVVTYSKVYGSMGVLPIFLVGMYFSWMIVIFGAQVAYAYQNRLAYLQEREAEGINQQGREFVALRLMSYVAQRFDVGEKPPSRVEMSKALCIPSQLVAQVILPLVAAKLLLEVQGEETGYAPARALDKISLDDILTALRVGLGRELATSNDPARAVIREQFERIILAEMQAANAVTLRNLVSRIDALPKSGEEGCRSETPPA